MDGRPGEAVTRNVLFARKVEDDLNTFDELQI